MNVIASLVRLGLYLDQRNRSLSCFATRSFQPYVNALAKPTSWVVACMNCVIILE